MALAPDPSDKLDAAADGAFGGKPVNRRAGYGDRLEMALKFARKGACLSAGEGQLIVEHYEDEIMRLRERVDALEAEKEDALSYSDTRDFTRGYMVKQRLAAVEAERDALREQLTHQTITLTAEHQRAERILAALREPSEAVVKAAGHEVLRYVDPNEGDMRNAIIAAVAAAEKEVGACDTP